MSGCAQGISPVSSHAGGVSPSDWVTRWLGQLPVGASVLDLACGSGRHVRWLAQQGLKVTALDRDAAAVEPLRALAQVVVADLEAQTWTELPGQIGNFDAVLVTNYLWRPLWPALRQAVKPGGLLVYETFALGHEAYGRPSRPDFLLRPGELLEAVRGWTVVAFEEGLLDGPLRRVQRIVARSPAAVTSESHLTDLHLRPT